MGWQSWVAGAGLGFGGGLPITVRWPKIKKPSDRPSPAMELINVVSNTLNGGVVMPSFLERLDAIEKTVETLGLRALPAVEAIDPALDGRIKAISALLADVVAALGGADAVAQAARPTATGRGPADWQFTGTGAPSVPPAFFTVTGGGVAAPSGPDTPEPPAGPLPPAAA